MKTMRIRVLLAFLAAAFATAVCSGGYITPGSLEETEQAAQDMMASAPTLAQLLSPTSTPVSKPASPTPTMAASPTPAESPTAAPPYLYAAQSGDTLAILAAR